MGNLLKLQILVALVTVSAAVPVPTEKPPVISDLSCLEEFQKIIRLYTDNFALFDKEEELNESKDVQAIPQRVDSSFNLKLPNLLDVSGNYTGLWVRPINVEEKSITSVKFNTEAFELSFQINLQGLRIDGESYHLEGSIGGSNVSGSGKNFYFEIPRITADVVIQFEKIGFQCAKGNYLVKDLDINFRNLGAIKISFPGFTVNGVVINWTEVNKALEDTQSQWLKSKDSIIKFLVASWNGLVQAHPIPAEDVMDILRTFLSSPDGAIH